MYNAIFDGKTTGLFDSALKDGEVVEVAGVDRELVSRKFDTGTGRYKVTTKEVAVSGQKQQGERTEPKRHRQTRKSKRS